VPETVSATLPRAAREDLVDPATGTWEVDARPLGDVLADPWAGHSPRGLVLALPVRTGGFEPSGTGSSVADALAVVGLEADFVAAAWEPSTEPGAVSVIPLRPRERAARTVLLVGVGGQTAADLRAAGAAVGRACRDRELLVTCCAVGRSTAQQTAFVEGCILGGYTPPQWTKAGPVRAAQPVRRAVLAGPHDASQVAAAVVRARATLVARNLAATPPNIKNPAWMVAQGRRVARRSGLDVRVWSDRDLRREGFGGLVAVGGGSTTPPRLVRLDYLPDGTAPPRRRVVLVGKGITFDTGGLDIKPPDAMLGMKTDVSGAAIVLAVLAACRALSVRVPVTGLLALAENAVGEASFRPGDVITQYGGRTVEVGNTDAEGRIVVADALAYANRELDPDVLVDIATLTGAARIALGRSLAPVYSTDERLRSELVTAGETSGELLWPYPLVEDYRAALHSDVADLNQVAPAVGGGSIVAALFLREFAGERAWAHLDIAGTARSDTDSGILSRGATGFGVRLLLTWLEGQ
jgi:leucyl aminopeptidase